MRDPVKPRFSVLFSFARLAMGLLMLVLASTLEAQQSTGAVNGIVADSTGAVVIDATVSLINSATRAERSVATNGQGLYVFSNVIPGTYALTVSKPGFSTQTKTGIAIDVNQTLTFNINLQVGAEATTVSVSASSASIETSTAELGSVIGHNSIVDLPLNGRNFTQLLILTPGASPIVTAQNSSGGESTAISSANVPISFPAMHGQSNRSNLFLLDGISDTESVFSSFSYVPPADDIQEFKVQSHNDQAQYGGITGGIINLVTKSGTNDVHGALWEFNRNQTFSAANPFTHLVVPLNWNQYGGNIGGPAVIPHLYNGRNRTFLFGSYEGFRLLTSSAGATRLVPTAAQLGSNGTTADFSGMGIPQLYDPYSTRLDPAHPGSYMRNPFPGNQIPLNHLDQNMLNFVKLLVPLPNAAISNTANYVDYTPSIQHQYTYNGRIDQNFGTRNSMWFRYSYLNQPSSASGGYPGLIAARTVDATNYGFSYLHIFNSDTTLNVQFGHNELNNNTYTHFTLGAASILGKIPFDKSFACNFASYGAPGSLNCVVPSLGVSGYTIGGENVSYNPPLTNLYQWNADFSRLWGHHLFQAGGIFMRDSENQVSIKPNINFTSSATATPEAIGSQNSGNTGNALASMLLGAVDNTLFAAIAAPDNGMKTSGVYVQDQFKATPNLTINVGLRYDVSFWPQFGTASHNTNAVGGIDFSNGTYILQRSIGDCATLKIAPCVPGGLPQANVIVSSNGHIWQNSYNNVEPRIGVAYGFHNSDVVRASYGIFYDELAGIKQETQNAAGTWPSLANQQIQNQSPLTSVPTTTPENPLASGSFTLPAATPFTGSAYYRDPHAKPDYSEEYNLGVQHALNSTTTIQIDYVGAHFVHLTTGGGLYNVALTPGPGNAATVASRRPYPNITPTRYDRSNGGGSYNGLEVQLRQSEFHGLGYNVSYTWSKTMDVACDGYFGVESCSEPDPYHINSDYSVAGYDLPQNLSISATYRLPIGNGRFVDTKNRLLDDLIGDWQLNGIYRYTSGQAFTMTVSGDTANTGNSGYRLVRVADPYKFGPVSANSSCQAPAYPAPNKLLFNPCAFTAPPAYTFGTEGRNSLRGGQFSNLDASLFKEVRITEGRRLQFRAEAFNLPNHISYSTPGTSISTPSSFGIVTGARSTERRLQLAIKFLY